APARPHKSTPLVLVDHVEPAPAVNDVHFGVALVGFLHQHFMVALDGREPILVEQPNALRAFGSAIYEVSKREQLVARLVETDLRQFRLKFIKAAVNVATYE